jgi:uncharacterized phage protein (TIGR01671 family)
VWLYGDLLQTEIAFQKMYSILDWSHAKQNTKSSELNVPVESVGQFTGLKDKNGKEIYEGDIVRLFHGHPSWLTDPFRVVFQNSAFALKKEDKSGSTAFATYLHDCVTNGIIKNDDDESALFEVIGNIYENPELIKDIQRA